LNNKGAETLWTCEELPYTEAGQQCAFDDRYCKCEKLIDVAVKIKIVNLPNIVDKGDVSDWLDAGGTVEKLLELIKTTSVYEPSIENTFTHDLSESKYVPYIATEKGLFRIKSTKDGDIPVQLTNFKCRIVADVIFDDGIEITHNFEMEVILNDKILQFTIPASQFAGMTWVKGTMK
jgi:hypothetical protein